MTIANPVRDPRTQDPKEIDRFYREVAKYFSYNQYAGDPSGNVTPRWIGDWCLDTVNSDWYRSTGLTDTDWKSTT
jgi:hypothetical protein